MRVFPEEKNNWLLIFLVGTVCFFILSGVYAIEPSGADLDVLVSERAPSAAPGSAQAIAGNVTQMNLQGYSVTQSWQGYYGNVTGTITLADASNNVLYNWSVANPRGEIYASTNSTIQWTNIQCFNYTANGSFGDDTANAGGTSQYGLNLTQLELSFNIPNDAPDGVDETFTFFGIGGHREFFSANLEFSEGQCRSTELYDYTGTQNGYFQQVLLYEPNSVSLVFASLLEQSAQGFDGNLYDFQMLVLEDGRGTNTATTTYYFFVEIE